MLSVRPQAERHHAGQQGETGDDFQHAPILSTWVTEFRFGSLGFYNNYARELANQRDVVGGPGETDSGALGHAACRDPGNVHVIAETRCLPPCLL